MKRVGGVAAVAAGLVALTGCGVVPQDGGSPSAPVSASNEADTGQSVAPWASVVSEQDATLSELIEDFEEDCITPALDPTATACTYKIETAKLRGQILRKDFEELGDPPAEVSTLVEQTLDAADGLAGIEVSSDCDSSTITADSYFLACAGESSNVRRLGKALLKKYAAWDPYGA